MPVRAAALAAAAAGAACAVAAAGCDWRAFDDQAARTPVLAIGAPPHYAAVNDFGRVVLPVTPAPGGSAAARYVVSAVSMPALAVIDLDAAGLASGRAVSPTVLSDGGANPVTALAEVPGASKVFMGASSRSGGRLYLMTIGASIDVALFGSSLNGDRLGLGVAAANLAGGAAADLVASSDQELLVYVDGDPAAPPLSFLSDASCPITIPAALDSRYALSRPLLVARLLAAGTQIAVGTPAASGPGTVSLFNVDAAGITCAQTLTATESRFGQALATGDFDADGTLDLLVGAPPAAAYLFKGPIGSGPVPTRITYADSAGQFGAALAAMNVDGKAGDEALISDSDAIVAGKTGAGAVVIYAGATLGTKLPLLTAHDPGGAAAYGASVSALPFCRPGCTPAELGHLALVGSSAQTFTYFLLGPTDTDPRRR